MNESLNLVILPGSIFERIVGDVKTFEPPLAAGLWVDGRWRMAEGSFRAREWIWGTILRREFQRGLTAEERHIPTVSPIFPPRLWGLPWSFTYDAVVEGAGGWEPLLSSNDCRADADMLTRSSCP